MKETTKGRVLAPPGDTLPIYTTQTTTASVLFGHAIEPIDNLETFRVIYQNPNGINPHPSNFSFSMSLRECYDQCAALICLTETNREWQLFDQAQQLRDAIRGIWSASVVQTSTSIEKFESAFKPGGTAMIVCDNHWVCRIKEKGADPYGLGRWTYTLLRGAPPIQLLNVNFYRVCSQTIRSAGEQTAFKQQYNILRERINTRADPRRQSIIDLQCWLMYFIRMGVDVILTLDGNEEITGTGRWIELDPYEPGIHQEAKDHDGSLATLVTSCGLVDVIARQHMAPYPATYVRGTKRIDFVFVTPRVMECVQRSSILPFHTIFGGDHRPILVDFDAKRLFRDTSHDIANPKSRGLKLDDPRLVNTYLELLEKQMKYHKVYEKMEALRQISSRGEWDSSHIEEYEKLDRIIVESDIYADRGVAKRFSTQYEWSPALVRAVGETRYWELRLKQTKGVAVSQATLETHRLQAKLPAQLTSQIVLKVDIIGALREARATLRDFQRSHVDLRRTHLEELAEAKLLDKRPWLSEEGQETRKAEQLDKTIKALIKREDIRKMHRQLGYVLHPERGCGLTQVDVPDTSASPPPGTTFGNPKDAKTWTGPWRSIKDPDEMARHIRRANIQEYNQADQTPFANTPLGHAVGKFANTVIADRILRGEALPNHLVEGLLDETKNLIAQLGKPYPVVPRQLQQEVTPSEYCKVYKALDEKISSSFSEVHIGHYKVATHSPNLTQLYSTRMSLPYLEHFSPKRWQVAVDVMLPKEEGNWKLHRLRIIQLYESDCNQSMRMIFARQLGHLLEDSNILPEMQFGSRPGHMSISPVLQKQLTYDIARMTHTVLGGCEIDAIGCYNRIANNLGFLQCRRLGIAQSAIDSLGKTWANMVHVIRTAYGTSKYTYRSTRKRQLYGPGQGSTNGPIFWLLMFLLIHDSFDPALRALLFICAWAQLTVSRYGDAFVDDANFGATSSHIEDPNLSLEDNYRLHELNVLEELTKVAQQYERLLYSTGGALNIKKCTWGLISWIWKNGKASLATIEQAPAELRLTSGDSTVRQTVPRLQPSATYRTLGVFLNGAGNTTVPKMILRGKAAAFAGAVQHVPLTPATAYQAFQVYFSPKIGYALPVSTFTYKECNFIQAPALLTILPKLKLNRNTARTIIHGPACFGGLTIKHAYVEQGIGQLRLFLGHLRNRDHTGQLLLVAMSYMQMLTGSTRLFLNLPFGKYAKWTEKTWLKSLWAFLDRSRFTVDVRRAWTPQLQRAGDSTLMTMFISMGYGARELLLLNRCRLFHQVFFISDIATADGRAIDPAYKQPVSFLERSSRWKWPIQGMPDRKSWNLWRGALAHLEHRDNLRVTLGDWLHLPHQIWKWTHDVATGKTYHETEAGMWCYDAITIGRTRAGSRLYWNMQGCLVHNLAELPARAPATVIHCQGEDDFFQVVFSGALPAPPPVVEDSVDAAESQGTFAHRLARIPDFFVRLLGPLRRITEETVLAIGAYIRDGTLLTCSDGSFLPDLGLASQAWVFADKEGHLLWGGAGPIDGHPDLITSYRSELGGIVTILFLLSELVAHLELQTGKVVLYCDNQGALDNVFNAHPKRGIYPLLERDYDLLGVARRLWRALPITVEGLWVKGHYDGPDREIKHDLNDLADRLATVFHDTVPPIHRTRRLPLNHPDYEAVVYYDGSQLTSSFRQIAYHQIYAGDLRQTIIKNAQWVSQFDRVDWRAYESAFKHLTIHQKIATAKLSHGLWNTGVQRRLYCSSATDTCPTCLVETETLAHVYRCTHPLSASMKVSLLEDLTEFLDKAQTPLPLRRSVVAGITWWLLQPSDAQPRAPTRGSIYRDDILAANAFAGQSSLGWDQMLRGRLSRLWGEAFAQIVGNIDDDGRIGWVKRLISKLWKLSFTIWQFRNDNLHGNTVAEARLKKQEQLAQAVREAYFQHEQNPGALLSSDQHLFEAPLQDHLLRSRQYLLCWLRSVQTARSQHHRDTVFWRTQGERFFGADTLEEEDISYEPSESGESLTSFDTWGSDLHRVFPASADISSPESYNLRRRSSRNGSDEDSDIPAHMFRDQVSTDSNYSPSEGSDPSLDNSFISQAEAIWLQLQDSSSVSSSTLPASESSEYFWDQRCRRSARPFQRVLCSSDEEASGSSIRVSQTRAGGGALQGISSPSLGSQSWAADCRFPLNQIGALREPASPPLDAAHCTSQDSVVSALSTTGASSYSSLKPGDYLCESYNAITDALDIHDAIARTFYWFQRSGFGVTAAVYWSIRSLPYFYAEEIRRAEQAGAKPLPVYTEDDLPPLDPRFEAGDVPRGLPDYVKCILTIDGLYSKDLRTFSTRQAAGRTHRHARWFPPQRVSVREIPIRELDDPPDDTSGITQNEVDWWITGGGWLE